MIFVKTTDSKQNVVLHISFIYNRFICKLAVEDKVCKHLPAQHYYSHEKSRKANLGISKNLLSCIYWDVHLFYLKYNLSKCGNKYISFIKINILFICFLITSLNNFTASLAFIRSNLIATPQQFLVYKIFIKINNLKTKSIKRDKQKLK